MLLGVGAELLMLETYDIRFANELVKRIEQDIASTLKSFGQGAWLVRDDAAASGMAAALLHAKVSGLQTALIHVDQVHKAMTGRIEPKEKRKD